MTCSLPCARGFDSPSRTPAIVHTENADDSDVGVVIACRATRIRSPEQLSVTIETSFVANALVDFFLLRYDALM